jgi:hypothetical protein
LVGLGGHYYIEAETGVASVAAAAVVAVVVAVAAGEAVVAVVVFVELGAAADAPSIAVAGEEIVVLVLPSCSSR